MLLGLRHPAVVRRHHQQREIHCAHAGHHVFHKILMPRHIHNPETVPGQFKMREAEVDGDATLFLFRQAVGIAASECLHQRALAMVNMTGRRENGVAGSHQSFPGSRLNLYVDFTGTSLPAISRCGPKK